MSKPRRPLKPSDIERLTSCEQCYVQNINGYIFKVWRVVDKFLIDSDRYNGFSEYDLKGAIDFMRKYGK